MQKTLKVVLCRTRAAKPLAVVHGLPGDWAELTPAQLRVLADRLLHIAADAERQPMHGRAYHEKRREYLLAPPSIDEMRGILKAPSNAGNQRREP